MSFGLNRYTEFWSLSILLKYVSFRYERYTEFGNCLKALEYMLFCTICYMVFWSLFEDAKICVVSYHMSHGVLVFVSKSLGYLKIRLYIYSYSQP